jgi:hypothetical protein
MKIKFECAMWGELLLPKSNEPDAVYDMAILANTATTRDSGHHQSQTAEQQRSLTLPAVIRGERWRKQKTDIRQSPIINPRRLT